MEEKMYITPIEVMDLWGVKQTTAYTLIRRINDELESEGYIVIQGKCPRDYFMERMGLHKFRKNNNNKSE